MNESEGGQPKPEVSEHADEARAGDSEGIGLGGSSVAAPGGGTAGNDSDEKASTEAPEGGIWQSAKGSPTLGDLLEFSEMDDNEKDLLRRSDSARFQDLESAERKMLNLFTDVIPRLDTRPIFTEYERILEDVSLPTTRIAEQLASVAFPTTRIAEQLASVAFPTTRIAEQIASMTLTAASSNLGAFVKAASELTSMQPELASALESEIVRHSSEPDDRPGGDMLLSERGRLLTAVYCGMLAMSLIAWLYIAQPEIFDAVWDVKEQVAMAVAVGVYVYRKLGEL